MIATKRLIKKLKRPIGEHFVNIHVGGSTGTTLQGIDDDMLIEMPLHHFGTSPIDGLALFVSPTA